MKEVNHDGLIEAVDKYLIGFKGDKTVIKIKEVDEKNQIVKYEKHSGTDEEKFKIEDGKKVHRKFKAYFDINAKNVKLYDEDELAIALTKM